MKAARAELGVPRLRRLGTRAQRHHHTRPHHVASTSELGESMLCCTCTLYLVLYCIVRPQGATPMMTFVEPKFPVQSRRGKCTGSDLVNLPNHARSLRHSHLVRAQIPSPIIHHHNMFIHTTTPTRNHDIGQGGQQRHAVITRSAQLPIFWVLQTR